MINENNVKKLNESEKIAKKLILKIRSEGKKVKCKICGGDRLLGRRVCKKCHSLERIKLNKERLKRINGLDVCFFCGKEIILYKKSQKVCKECYYEGLGVRMKKKWAEKRIKISSNLNKNFSSSSAK